MTGTRLDYNTMALEYAAHRKVHPGVLANLIEMGRISDASVVLEVGVGSGNYATAVRAMTGCTVLGLDPSREMLAKAAAQDGDLVLLEGRAESLPYPDASVDVIYSVDVIHHVEDRPAFFREALRVLRPGGKVCTVTDSPDDIRRRVPLSSHFPETVEVELRRYPSIAKLTIELLGAGFGQIVEDQVELTYPLTRADGYAARAYSSLHLISDEAWSAGVDRMRNELAAGPISALSLYTLLWGRRP